MTDVKVLATGSEFLKKGVRSFEPVIEEMLTSAKQEIQIISYVLTKSAKRFIRLIQDAAKRGVRVTLILDSGEVRSREVRRWLETTDKNYEGVDVLSFSDARGSRLHAKVLVVDRSRAVIGSANLSWGGMVGNYEIGVLVEGDPAWKISQLADSLAQSIRRESNR